MKGGKISGGYEEGYANCDCFWGAAPGSLVSEFLKRNPSLKGFRVLDLGCGEGKNAAAFAKAGAKVVAVDCSSQALKNGQKAFPSPEIEWRQSDALSFLATSDEFDAIVMYGLLHCLPASEISSVIQVALKRTSLGGHHFLVAFNDGPHDLSAHPNFSPTLLPHEFYLEQYSGQTILLQSSSVLRETHPNNNIPHFHSLTRIVAKRDR